MKKNIKYILGILVLLFPFGCRNKASFQSSSSQFSLKPISFINQDGQAVALDVEIADTNEERAKGLMFRESLPENQGMLFVFEQPDRYGFWMKNTLIPLEMIFIDKNKKIVDIIHAVPCKQDPCISYIPKAAALYVVEVNEGYCAKYKISIGDSVII